MIVDKKNWKEVFSDFSIYDCAIRNRDMYMFVLVGNSDDQHRDPLPKTRFLMVYGDEPVEDRFYYSDFDDFGFTSIAFHNNPSWEFIAVDTGATVYSHNTDQDDSEHMINTDWPVKNKKGEVRGAAIQNVVRVNGQIYALGTERRIYRRKGIGSWVDIALEGGGPEFPKARLEKGSLFDYGFNDMSAFGKDDIYTVGGVGDIWHFNGKKWQQVHFPANELLNTVCCAGDGNVYITGNNGSLWAGREDKWKRLAKGELSLAFKDSAWFAGRLYCGNDYGLWVLKDGKLKSLQDEVDSVVATSCGRIDISPDGLLMLTAGQHGATLFDGKKWEVLFNAFQLG